MTSRFPLQVLKDENAPAAALLAVVTAKYGTECYEWEPEFLRDELQKDFGFEMSDLQSDKLQAGILVLTSSLFEDQWSVFTTVCTLLLNHPASFADFEPLEAEDIAAALAHARVIVHDDEDRLAFSDETNAYCGLIFYDYGLGCAPHVMPTAIIQDPAEPCDDLDKNAALDSVAVAMTEKVKNYLASLAPLIAVDRL